MKYLQWVGSEVCNLPTYEGLPNLDTFLIEFEDKIIEPHRLLALEVAMKETIASWWAMQKQSISEWPQCHRLLQVIFGENVSFLGKKHTCLTYLIDHLEICRATWNMVPQQE